MNVFNVKITQNSFMFFIMKFKQKYKYRNLGAAAVVLYKFGQAVKNMIIAYGSTLGLPFTTNSIEHMIQYYLYQ